MITTDYNNSFCKIQYFNSINNRKSSNPIAYNKLIKFLFLKVNSSSFSAILAQSWFLRIMFSFCSRADLSSISPASLRILSISGPPSVIWSVGQSWADLILNSWSFSGWHQDHRKRLKKFYSKFSYLNWISSNFYFTPFLPLYFHIVFETYF